MEKISVTLDLPVYKEYDVAVVGGGCSGSIAALGAARNGAKTILLERSGVLGGNMSQGLVQSIHGYRSDNNINGKKVPAADWSNALVVPKSSITMELYNRIHDSGGTAFPGHHNAPSLRENVDEEVVIYTLDKMMKESNVDVLFNTYVFDVIMNGDTVTGIVIANKSGPQIIKSGIVIDCSADADIATRAGVDYLYGEEEFGYRAHGISLKMELGGIDVNRYLEYLYNRPELTAEEQKVYDQDVKDLLNGGEDVPLTIRSFDGTEKGAFTQAGERAHRKVTIEDQLKALANNEFLMTRNMLKREWVQYIKDHPEIPYMPNTLTLKPIYPTFPHLAQFGLVRNGRIRYDQTMLGVSECFVDSTNEEELSKGILLCREINWIQVNFLRERIPGFEDSYIIKTATYGGRESRQIVGEYMVLLDDLREGRIFEDNIAFCWRANNRHLLNGQIGTRIWYEPPKPFSFPYRCLIPRGVDGLLVAGRTVSKEVLVRVSSMVPCMQLGEAAGIAAGIATVDKVSIREVDVNKVQKALHLDEVAIELGIDIDK